MRVRLVEHVEEVVELDRLRRRVLESGIVAPSGKPCGDVPRVTSMYLRPSAERGRMMIVESTGSGLMPVSSFRSSFA